MSGRRFAGAGLLRRSGTREAIGSASGGAPPSLTALGADLLGHWEMALDGSPYVTVASGNVAQLYERKNAVAHMVAAAANRPNYNATGGPGGSLPYCNLQDGNRCLVAPMSIAAGNRACLYVVAACNNVNGYVVFRMVHAASQTRLIPSATQYIMQTSFTGGLVGVTVTSPAKDLNWHLFAIRPLATGALFQIDGATTSPNYATSNTLTEIVDVRFGLDTSSNAGDGRFYAAFLVDNADASKDAIVKNYVATVTGLTIA